MRVLAWLLTTYFNAIALGLSSVCLSFPCLPGQSNEGDRASICLSQLFFRPKNSSGKSDSVFEIMVRILAIQEGRASPNWVMHTLKVEYGKVDR